MAINVLHIAKDFDLVSGITRYISTLLKLFRDDKEYKLHLVVNRGDAIQTIREQDFLINVISFKVGLKGLSGFLTTKRSIEKYCLENKINIIHTHHRYPELIASQIAKRNRIKTITTAHSIVSGFKFLSFKSDKILAVSNHVSQYLIGKFRVPEEKIVVLNNCILNEYENKSKTYEPNDKSDSNSKIILLYAGRFSKEKGTDILLETFELLKGKYDIELWLLGMNYDLSLNSINDKSIKIISPVADIENIYNQADIFILPSRVDPFPYFMLEAGLFQKPFIGSCADGIAEFIEDGVDGFLVNPGDIFDLKEKIEFVINNLSETRETGSRLHKKVILKCNCENYISKLKELYKEFV